MEIIEKARALRLDLKSKNDFSENPIDDSLPVIPPFMGKDIINLIIIGQDPTVKNEASRKKITCTLNLDKNNSLKIYIESICRGLGITLENVYATNLFKYFYKQPPANTPEVLFQHLNPNLNLLKLELSEFDNIPIITLGEPVLRLLTFDKDKVRKYWDYNTKTKETNGDFKFSHSKDNKLGRDFYPFPHQPSIRKEFYTKTFNYYIEFFNKG